MIVQVSQALGTMSDDNLEFFRCPAYKLMISDIKCAVQRGGDNNEKDNEEIEWILTFNNVSTRSGNLLIKTALPSKPPVDLNLKLVWIQGTVIRIEETDTGNLSLVISDEDDKTEEAVIFEYNTVPGGDHPDIKIGSYVGTLGQIWSNDPVTIKATKVMFLSDKEKPLCRTIWTDEVALSKAFLSGLIEPSLSV